MSKSLERLAIICVAALVLSGCNSGLTSRRNTSNISKSTTPEHITALKEGAIDARRMAAHCLWQIGSEATEATPVLIDALHDEDAEVRMEAARALGRTGVDEAKVIPALLNAVKDKEASVRVQALASLLELQEQAQPEAKTVVPVLLEALKNKNEDIQCGAAKVMMNFGKHSQAAVPSLMDVLKASQPDTRLYAALALARIGPASKPALPQLLELGQNDANIGVRVNAVIAVGHVGAEAKSVVPFLIERLKEDDGDIQCAAALALIQMGPPAKDAITALTEVVHHSGGRTKQLSQAAIDSLNGKRRPRPDPAQMSGRGGHDRAMMMQMMKGAPSKGP